MTLISISLNPTLTYSLHRADAAFRPPLEETVDYVRQVTFYKNSTTGKLEGWVRGQWSTRSGARSRQSRSVKVDIGYEHNPDWLKDLIKDAKRRLK